MKEFEHERLDVYKAAIELLVLADAVAATLPRARGYLAEQLGRAASSISFNIAEGAGEFASDEKARFYRMARRSGTESAAFFEACLHRSREMTRVCSREMTRRRCPRA